MRSLIVEKDKKKDDDQLKQFEDITEKDFYKVMEEICEGKEFNDACIELKIKPGALMRWIYSGNVATKKEKKHAEGKEIAVATGNSGDGEGVENTHVTEFEKFQIIQASALFHNLIYIIRDTICPIRARLLIDTYKWILTKKDPLKYGDRKDTATNDNVTVQLNFSKGQLPPKMQQAINVDTIKNKSIPKEIPEINLKD